MNYGYCKTEEDAHNLINDYSYAANNIVMVHIFKLRHKIEADCKHPTILKTAWGKGYYID